VIASSRNIATVPSWSFHGRVDFVADDGGAQPPNADLGMSEGHMGAPDVTDPGPLAALLCPPGSVLCPAYVQGSDAWPISGHKPDTALPGFPHIRVAQLLLSTRRTLQERRDMDTTDLTPILLRNLRADIVELKTELDARFDVVHRELDRRVTSEEFHDAMLALNKSLERTHARVVDADMRAFTAQRENQIILGRIQEHLDARYGLEDRVARCEDDIAALKDRTR
jgi:hypothetical protein